MSQDPNAETLETWQVAIAPDNVQVMTLEQLDAAYDQGVITEQTLVWTEGMEEWLALADVLGSEDEAEAAAPAEPTVPVVAPAFSQPPVGAAPVVAAVPSYAPQAASFPPAGFAPSPFASAPGGSVPSGLQAPVSTAPVAMSLEGLDLDSFNAPKSGGKGKMIFAAVAAMAVIGGGIALAGGGEGEAAPTAAVAAQPVAAVGELAKNDPNAPLDMVGVTGYQVSDKETKQFEAQAKQEGEMKAKMAEALAAKGDDADEKKAAPKTKRASYSKSGGKSKSKSSGSSMKSGGSAFDPLNSSLP